MKTKAELFAYFTECLAVSAIVWVAAVSFIMIDAETPPPGVLWVLLMTLAVSLFYIAILRRGTTVARLAVASLILAAGEVTAYIILYEGSISFPYVLTCLLWSGISVYVPMYFAMSRQLLARHITIIDVMIAALVWLVVFYSAIEPDTASAFLVIIVTVLTAAAAIGLRMSEEGMNEGIGKAFALAAASLAAAAGIIFLLVRLFSRSGAVTGAVLQGIRMFFLEIFGLVRKLLEWLASFASPSEAGTPTEMMPQAGPDPAAEVMEEIPINPVIPALIIGAAAAVTAILILRKIAKNRVSWMARIGGADSGVRTRRKRGLFAGKWKDFITGLKFRIRSLIERNTPPGVLVWLERRASKKKIPRQKGESIREFIFRLAPDGTLDLLAEDLEKRFYGGSDYSLSSGKCRSIRKEMKKRFRTHG